MGSSTTPFAEALGIFPQSAVRQSIVSPWMFYKLQEGSGIVAADTAGRGPNLAPQAGAVTTEWGNAGYYTPVGTQNSVLRATNTSLDALFNLANVVGKQLLICFDFYFDGGVTASETIMGFGANTTAGGWWITLNTSNQLGFGFKAVGSNSLSSNAMSGFNMGTDADAGSNKRFTIGLDIRVVGAYPNAVGSCSVYCNGVSKTSAVNLDLNQAANSGTALPGATVGQPFALAGRKSSTGSDTYDQTLHSGASNGRLAMVFAMLKSTPDDYIAAQMSRDFYNLRGEYPQVLRAA